MQHLVLGFDEVIEENDSDYAQSGLKVASLIRLGLVATIPKETVLGQLGAIADDRLERLRARLAQRIKAEQNAPPNP
jgi:mRNA interferase MazF